MLLNIAAHNVSLQNMKVSKRECHITYSVTKCTASQNFKCILRTRYKRFCNVYTFCDAVRYVTFTFFKILRFGTLTFCAAMFCNITSCDVYVMLLYVMKQHRCTPPPPQSASFFWLILKKIVKSYYYAKCTESTHSEKVVA